MKNTLTLLGAGMLAVAGILMATSLPVLGGVEAAPITIAMPNSSNDGCDDRELPQAEMEWRDLPQDWGRTREPEPTRRPRGTRTPRLTQTPQPTRTPELTRTPDQTETPRATGTPCATRTVHPTETPETTRTPEGTETPRPSETPRSTGTPEATRTPSGTATPTAPASSSAGRLLASNCFQCHGTDGHSVSGIDSIAGESVNEIIGEMSEMSAGTIGNNIMKAHARAYTAEEIRLIAEYLATR